MKALRSPFPLPTGEDSPGRLFGKDTSTAVSQSGVRRCSKTDKKMTKLRHGFTVLKRKLEETLKGRLFGVWGGGG